MIANVLSLLKRTKNSLDEEQQEWLLYVMVGLQAVVREQVKYAEGVLDVRKE